MNLSIETVTLLERTLWAGMALAPILIGLGKGLVEYLGIRRRRRTVVMVGRSFNPRRSTAAA